VTPRAVRDHLVAQRVVPVLRLKSADETERAAGCLREAGFTTFEITLTTPGAIALIAALKSKFGAGAVVGAGTVLDLDAARACVDAGAQFLVSPCVVTGLAALAHDAGRAALIGGFNQVRGAILGGLLLGVIDNFCAVYISSNYRMAIPLLILIVVILVRPQGLLGRVEERTV